ncbi:MAG: 5'/3'-nucleotidase SurE [Spirochaetaceae bacterium]|jgi:5'-nucleotidase|nr:5'/3'-nucleotidase SurE [Spirochaetaceae bacterium]
MNLLLTNDDGIECKSFLQFAESIRKARPQDRLFVLAPHKNRSGISHALVGLHEDLEVLPKGPAAWSCSGSPADCVGVALMGGLSTLSKAPDGEIIMPDMVIAGINVGANLGTDLIFSGTAAAARHGALYGVPSVALSLCGHWNEEFYWDRAISYSIEHLDEYKALWEENYFINVNLPNSKEPYKDSIMTFPSIRRYTDSIGFVDETTCRLQWGEIVTTPEAGSDWDAIIKGKVSVSKIFLHPVSDNNRGT